MQWTMKKLTCENELRSVLGLASYRGTETQLPSSCASQRNRNAPMRATAHLLQSFLFSFDRIALNHKGGGGGVGSHPPLLTFSFPTMWFSTIRWHFLQPASINKIPLSDNVFLFGGSILDSRVNNYGWNHRLIR